MIARLRRSLAARRPRDAYSQVGQLLSETPSGSSAVTYAYNGDGLRVSKAASGTTESYTYDTLGSVPLVLQDGNSSFIYGPGGTVVEQEKAASVTRPVISGVGTLASNVASGLTTLAVTPATAGDALIVSIWALSPTATVSSVSGGGVTTWTKIEGFENSYPSDQELWMGTVTSTGSSTITVGFSGSVTGDLVELSAKEFTAGLGTSTAWSVDTAAAQNNGSSTSVPFPILTPAGSSELYFGYGGVPGTSSAGSTSGFTYAGTAGSNVIAYDPGVSSTVSPTAAQSPAGVSWALAALITASNSATGGSPLFYVDDALGSTQWLLNLSGSVVGSYAYSTYGSTLSHTGTSSTPIGFAGAYTDAESGFLYLVNRYYDPVTDQFLSVDPDVIDSGQPYTFTGDDPLNATDPLGMIPTCGGQAGDCVQSSPGRPEVVDSPNPPPTPKTTAPSGKCEGPGAPTEQQLIGCSDYTITGKPSAPTNSGTSQWSNAATTFGTILDSLLPVHLHPVRRILLMSHLVMAPDTSWELGLIRVKSSRLFSLRSNGPYQERSPLAPSGAV